MQEDYQFHLEKDKSSKKGLHLSLVNKEEYNKYEIYLNEISPFWIKNMKYFKNSFDQFYDILQLVFVNKSKEIQWSILEETEEKIEINIIYNPGLIIFGFDIIIEIPREEDRLERLIKKVEKIEKENKYLLNLFKDQKELKKEV